MDALKAEIALKRKAFDVPASSGRPSKYMRKGDIDRIKEEQERKARDEKEAKEREVRAEEQAEKAAKAGVSRRCYSLTSTVQLIYNGEQTPLRSATDSPRPDGLKLTDSPTPDPQSATFNISNEEAVRRLRAKGQPIRLFSESDRDRCLRLRALELIEEKEHERHGGQNDFKKALEDVETRAQKEMAEKAKKKGGKEAKDGSVEMLDLGLVKSDPDKLYPLIYYALKRTLKEWEEWMDDRPGKLSPHHLAQLCLTCLVEEVKRTTQGKLAAATQGQSAEYLKPLFKLLRARVCYTLCSHRFLRLICEFSHYRQTCLPVSRRSSTICKSVNIRGPTTPTYGYLSEMPLGLLELPWLGEPKICLSNILNPTNDCSVFMNVRPARRFPPTKSLMC